MHTKLKQMTGLVMTVAMVSACQEPTPVQLLPVPCQNLSSTAASLAVAPTPMLWSRVDVLLPQVRQLVVATLAKGTSALAKKTLDSLWQTDSAATEFSLALITSGEEYGTSHESEAASVQYSQRSGRPGPMISAMFASRSPSRRGLSLVAIRALADSVQELSVLYFACNALWELRALASDTAYQRLWKSTTASTQYFMDISVLIQSTRLLSGAARSVVVDAIPTVMPYFQPIPIMLPVDSAGFHAP